MAIRFASILVPIFLAFIGLGAVAVMEYQKHKMGAKSFGTEELGPMEYIRDRYAAFKTKRAVEAAVRELSIAKALPAAAEGWTRAEYEVAHGVAITGVTFEPSAVVKDTEKSIQDAFRFVQRKKREGAVASYLNGAQIVSLKIRQVKAPDPTTLEGGLAVRMGAVADGLKEPQNAFAVIEDTQYVLLPQLSKNYFSQDVRPVSYRRIEGNYGGLFDIFVFTNADDAAVRAVLEGVDYTLLEDYLRATVMAQNLSNPAAAQQVASEPETEADTAATQQAETAPEGAEGSTSLLEKLGDLFASRGSDDAEEEERIRMICTTQRGFKHCAFPKEEE